MAKRSVFKPDSMIARALLMLAAKGPTVSAREFSSILSQVCDDKHQMHALASQLAQRGFIDRHISLSAGGVSHVETLRGGST